MWTDPDTYEIESLGVDRAGVIETAMRLIRGWAGMQMLDIGRETGFRLPRFASSRRRGGAAGRDPR